MEKGMEAGKHKQDCKEVFELLSEYLDAGLDAKTCDEIEQHLAGCPPCIEFLQSLRRTVGLCKHCEPAAAIPPLTAGQQEQLRVAYRKALAKKA